MVDAYPPDDDRELGPTAGPEPVVLPLDGVLDLHAFHPRDVPSAAEEYLRACREAGVLRIRLIHGKGTGVQRRRIRSLLARLPWVASFATPDEGGGGWGATEVLLRPLPPERAKEPAGGG